MRTLRSTVAAFALLASLGCSSDPAIMRMTLVTTSPMAPPEILSEYVEGRACFYRNFIQALLTPPWLAKRANHALAIENALEPYPEANVMTDVVLRVDFSQFILFQRTCAVVTGQLGRMR
jgi:hypothetical protein